MLSLDRADVHLCVPTPTCTPSFSSTAISIQDDTISSTLCRGKSKECTSESEGLATDKKHTTTNAAIHAKDAIDMAPVASRKRMRAEEENQEENQEGEHHDGHGRVSGLQQQQGGDWWLQEDGAAHVHAWLFES
jgi:hypothetical protein